MRRITLICASICAPICAGAATIALALSGCQAVMNITDQSAQIASSAGVLEKDKADAISKSSKAVAKAAEEITPEQEYFIGRAVGANILSFYKIYTKDPALTAYLNKICLAIAINSPVPQIYNGYHAAVLDSSEINAFATSGGHIFVTRGLIAATKSEDALAAVIAHEIAHIQLHHSINAIDNSRLTQALLVVGSSAAAASKNKDLIKLTKIFDESVSEIVTTMVEKGYSQSQEFDADKTALALLAAAGYDPSSIVEMLESLKTTAQKGGFGKTHPTPAKRIAAVQKSVQDYPSSNTRSYREKRFKTALK
ncbi:peptidase M48 [Campylobacterota bacterium]|nr:peptidase M48 [Campylobacterota bacterium]